MKNLYLQVTKFAIIYLFIIQQAYFYITCMLIRIFIRLFIANNSYSSMQSNSGIYKGHSHNNFLSFNLGKRFLHISQINYKKIVKSSSKSKKPFNDKLSNFLSQISLVLDEHKNDLYKAQLIIEEEWLDLCHNSIDFSKSLHSNKRKILYKALDIIILFKDGGNLRKQFPKVIKDYIVNIEHVYITFSILISNYSKSSLTNLDYNVGFSITKHIYIKNFTKEFQDLDSFIKYHNFDTPAFVRLGHVFIETFTSSLNQVFKRLFVNDSYIVMLNPEYENEIQDSLIISPQSLPMVCEPLKWSANQYGGNLLNNTDNYKNELVVGSHQHSHQIMVNDDVYNAVNRLNSLKFKVNADLVDYIQNDGFYILEYFKKQKYDTYINNIITLDIAKVYINTPFHLNVNIDWRGRIYTQSFYLDYQGSEFALALINFNEGKKLDEKGIFFFYVYGANVYNHEGINKKSMQERYNWVLNNLDNIYMLSKDFILKAESPATFAAFCLTMKKLKDDPNYIVHNPIFLDATCSGVQHFAAMLLDLELSRYVNLVNADDHVKDFYSVLVPKINQAINDSWANKDVKNYKFAEICLDRSLLKKVIMTKSYNVTTYGITEQLKSKLEKVAKTITYKEREIEVYDYKVPAKNNTYVILDLIEVELLSDIINNNIFNNFPILHSIYTYLTRLAKIYMKLNIPISWSTPNGLELVQSYNQSKIQKIKINFLGKNRTAVLRKWTDVKDTRREVQAIIPNIIHSLDASHLRMLINKWDKYILPIHDCFGTHPNDMFKLSELVRETFVLLYSDMNFLKNIDDKFKQNLHDYKVKIISKDDEDFVEIEVSRNKSIFLPMPVLPKSGNLKLNDIIIKGQYMIT